MSCTVTAPSLSKSAKQQPSMLMPVQELAITIAWAIPGVSTQSVPMTLTRQVVPQQQVTSRSAKRTHPGVGGQVICPGCARPTHAAGSTSVHVPSEWQHAVGTCGHGFDRQLVTVPDHVPEASRQGSCGATRQTPLVQQVPNWQTVVEHATPIAMNWPVHKDCATTVHVPVGAQQAPAANTHGEAVQVSPSVNTPPAAMHDTLELKTQVAGAEQHRPVVAHGYAKHVWPETHAEGAGQSSTGTSVHWPPVVQQTPDWHDVAVQAVLTPRN